MLIVIYFETSQLFPLQTSDQQQPSLIQIVALFTRYILKILPTSVE